MPKRVEDSRNENQIFRSKSNTPIPRVKCILVPEKDRICICAVASVLWDLCCGICAVVSMLWLSVCSGFLRTSGGFISKTMLVESGENYSD